MVVTVGRRNNAQVRQVLDPVYKNVLQKQNPFETEGGLLPGLHNQSLHRFNSPLSTLISLSYLTFHKLCLKQNQKQSPKLQLVRTRLCWKRKEEALISDKLNRLLPNATKIFKGAPETTAVTNTEKSLEIWKAVW